MPDPLFADDDEANTPLTAEEREQLIPAYITLRHEIKHPAASSEVLKALFMLLVFNQPSPQGARN